MYPVTSKAEWRKKVQKKKLPYGEGNGMPRNSPKTSRKVLRVLRMAKESLYQPSYNKVSL